ncbi:MAG: DUF2158 domain-containing protein [Planctomycetota bacterium]
MADETNEIVVGQIVELKSGGPKMTVAFFNESGAAICQWFAGEKIEREAFKTAVLQPSEGHAHST